MPGAPPAASRDSTRATRVYTRAGFLVIDVGHGVLIPEHELTFTASRAGGPGGQHVNKVSSRVTLRFDLARSASLSDEQKALLGQRLRSRIGADGVLRVVSQQSRSQAANRDAAVERFAELLREALSVDPPRRATRVPRAADRQRLERKRQQALRKRERTGTGWDE